VTDIFPPEKRSEIMRRIRSYGTRPELRVKELLDRLGVGYVH
jgi:G:T-mismatch repair DNA endonuclease (very short patch repair protein)